MMLGATSPLYGARDIQKAYATTLGS